MTLRGFDWKAGARKLDAQAVSDLIACGWLAIPDRFGHARITAVPLLAI